jgi:hypothetical protein
MVLGACALRLSTIPHICINFLCITQCRLVEDQTSSTTMVRSAQLSPKNDYEAYLFEPNRRASASSSASGDSSLASSSGGNDSSDDGFYDEAGHPVVSPTGRSKRKKKAKGGSVGSSDTNNTSSKGDIPSRPSKGFFANHLFHFLFPPSGEHRSQRSHDESPGLGGDGIKETDVETRWYTSRRVKWFIVFLLAGAGLGVSIGAYHVVAKSQHTDFTESVSSNAGSLIPTQPLGP